MKKADSAFTNKQFIKPDKENAVELYKKVLDISPENTHASKKLSEIADFYESRIRSYIQSGDIKSASDYFTILGSVFPEHSNIDQLKTDFTSKQDQLFADNKARLEKEKLLARQKLEAKKKQDAEMKLAAKKRRDKALSAIKHLIPVGINQQQQAEQVVQDIMGAFLTSFIKQDIAAIKQVAQLNEQYSALYSSIFKLYKSINIRVIPGTFILLKDINTAKVQFQMVDLIENSGRRVEATADWTKISLQIKKKNGVWLKAEVGGV